MPIVEVEVVMRPGESLENTAAKRLADVAGEIFGSPTGQTWVKLRRIEPGDYAEQGDSVPGDIYPVFVSVIKARLPSPMLMHEESRQLSLSIAEICNRSPENVHILYEPPAIGRIAFGGILRHESEE